MSTGVIFILGKGVIPILALGVRSTWPQGSSAPGFSNYICFSHVVLNLISFYNAKLLKIRVFRNE